MSRAKLCGLYRPIVADHRLLALCLCEARFLGVDRKTCQCGIGDSTTRAHHRVGHDGLGEYRMKVSDVLRRSTLGTGWYAVRRNGDSDGDEIRGALIEAGACAVQHSGMFESIVLAIGFPGGCLYEVVLGYGFLDLQEGTWIFGPSAVRQVFRILDFGQPTRLLSGEAAIPTRAEVAANWDDFAGQDRLDRIGLSLGALVWMKMPWLKCGRSANPDHFEPIRLPIEWSRDKPPPDCESPMTDPRCNDSMYWTSENTCVIDVTGAYHLDPDGTLTRYSR